MNGISPLDICILILFLYFILKGYNKGFIKQTSRLFGLLLALIIAMNSYKSFQSYLTPYFDFSPQILQFMSFAILFILVNLFIHILGMVLKNMVDLLFLDPIDHIAGAALGLIKGVIFTYLLVLLLDQIPYMFFVRLMDESFLATGLLEFTPLIEKNLQQIFRP